MSTNQYESCPNNLMVRWISCSNIPHLTWDFVLAPEGFGDFFKHPTEHPSCLLEKKATWKCVLRNFAHNERNLEKYSSGFRCQIDRHRLHTAACNFFLILMHEGVPRPTHKNRKHAFPKFFVYRRWVFFINLTLVFAIHRKIVFAAWELAGCR